MILLRIFGWVLFFSTLAHAEPGWITEDPPYLKSVHPKVQVFPLLTVGESLPKTSDFNQSMTLVGRTDGMGLAAINENIAQLYVNHEISRGSFVSTFLLSRNFPPRFLSGDIVKPRQKISRLCSGFLASPKQGFDRLIYLTGEEANTPLTSSLKGGQAFAFVGQEVLPLPEMGFFRKENLIVLPQTGNQTFVLSLEDGPKGLESQLYLYVGQKMPSSSALQVNGLQSGLLYVWTSPGHQSENDFFEKGKSIDGKWALIPNASQLNEFKLEEVVDSLEAFAFNRLEDGATDPRNPRTFYFASTGGSSQKNQRGRLYRLKLGPSDPLGEPSSLTILLSGDLGDPIFSPDNIDANVKGEILIQEDFTSDNNRLPSIWKYHPDSKQLVRLAEINGDLANNPTSWESSGVIDASEIYGEGTWFVNVQAHGIDAKTAGKMQGLKDVELVEGGQILMLVDRSR